MRSEFELINYLKRKTLDSSKLNPKLKVGIGDDCAVISKDSKTDLVITSDLLVEDIDFRLAWTRAEYLGHKALAVSLSDVAAMGAKPCWAMLSIGVPAKIWKTNFVDEFYKGFFKLAKKFHVALVGGDVSKTPDKIVIDSFLAGETKKGKAILRSGAKPGDLIFVTGELGGAAAGLKLLEKGERFEKSSKNPSQKLLLRQLKPNAQTEIGQILGEKNLATAMIDVSDGLSSDLAHLCRASGVGARVFTDNIPFHKHLKNVVETLEEKLDFALNGGEDFELLFTIDPKKISQLEKELEKFSFSRIGEIVANATIIELIEKERSRVLEPHGFRHF
jgi:thiamine-monophosphate kinase